MFYLNPSRRTLEIYEKRNPHELFLAKLEGKQPLGTTKREGE